MVGVAAEAERGPTYKKGVGPYPVETLLLDWKDGKRDRVVPVKVYLPRKLAGPMPVVLFSHGLGGSREGYGYLGKHWASHGYVCVHLQHVGSDESVWKGKANAMEEMRKAAKVPSNAVARPLDVRFVLDQLTKANDEAGPLRGKLDLEKVGLAGHSFGAFTTLASAGQGFVTPLGKTLTLTEPRLKAAIAMSPNAPARRSDLKKVFAPIKIPIFHMTGTKDDGVTITETKPIDRRIPFDHIAAGDQYLLIFQDGDHMVFSGRGQTGAGKREKDPVFQALILQGSTAFWDAYLRGDARAKEWLKTSYKSALDREGTFEMK
ncbi:MAG: hypothetical protein U0840_03485 [Gemmataceae bacterium]